GRSAIGALGGSSYSGRRGRLGCGLGALCGRAREQRSQGRAKNGRSKDGLSSSIPSSRRAGTPGGCKQLLLRHRNLPDVGWAGERLGRSQVITNPCSPCWGDEPPASGTPVGSKKHSVKQTLNDFSLYVAASQHGKTGRGSIPARRRLSNGDVS